MKSILLSGVFGIIAIISFLFTPGQPVPGAEVYIRQEGNNQPAAFMQTGDNGKVTFAHLTSGVYRIEVTLPQQSGKLMRGRDNINCELQVGYHSGKKQYYLREPEGFFTFNYGKIKRLENKNITPVYNLYYDGNVKVVEIGKFEASGNNASFTLEMRAQKPKKFEKMVEKIKGDIEMVTIRSNR
ncbi:MAG: carboxypeptidase-like regulatory domain-containing protein [Mariniphaga sp.]